MPNLDLRPLSLGEILDRTFTLYRRHFLLFIGICGIPQLLVLAFSLTQIFATASTRVSVSLSLILMLLFVVASLVAYILSQGGTILAVSELYLGRSASIGAALRKVSGEFAPLLGVIVLNGLAVMGGAILLVIPGIYVACRLIICLPVALIEGKGPRDSLSRSWDLTRENAGRSFLILLLSIIIAYAALAFFAAPFTIAVALNVRNPGMLHFWTAMLQIGSTIATVLTRPILLIATSIFYYDLRVRKEAFDIQFMLNPESQRAPNAAGLPSIV